MTVTRRGLAALPFALVTTLYPRPVRSGEMSAWVQGFHSRVRLVAGGASDSTETRFVGVAIELDPGFKTYWRHPGESGLPPSFDWSGSANLAKAEILWPAPARFEDRAGISYGYKDRVLFPVRITPADAAKAVALSLKLDYGVCKDICIPASAKLAIKLEEASGRSAVLEEALARVPVRQPLGALGELSILGLHTQPAGDKPSIMVAVRAPAEATLFVEAPDNWYLSAGPMKSDGREAGGAKGRFRVEILERPRVASGALDLRLTLVSGARAVETAASLDTAQLPR